MRWKIDGKPVPKNPSKASRELIKNIDYQKTIFGQTVKIVPPRNLITVEIDTAWTGVSESFKDELYLMYLSNRSFLLETHTKDSSQETWTMIIRDFSSEHSIFGSQPRADLYNLSIVFRSVDEQEVV